MHATKHELIIKRMLLAALALVIILPTSFAYPQKSSRFKGWDYLANKLIADGVPETKVKEIFSSKRMPTRPFVPFGIKPSEPKNIYSGFLKKSRMLRAKRFLEKHPEIYAQAEAKYRVSRHVINAILYVETQFGTFTGNNPILVRLARGASVGEKSNVLKNYRRLIKSGEKTSLKEVQDRSRKVEDIFYPEVKSLITIGKKLDIDIFRIFGSRAGAFGLPQFLPSSYLKFAVDGNGDNKVSLYQIPDAIHSVGNYLAYHGWRDSASRAEKRDVIWTYNKSEPYCETILRVSEFTAGKKHR